MEGKKYECKKCGKAFSDEGEGQDAEVRPLREHGGRALAGEAGRFIVRAARPLYLKIAKGMAAPFPEPTD